MISKKILIADDDSLVRNVLRSFLESQTRFKVCGEAVNGLDAIEKARTLNPDLIVMDLSMPVMNGIEAGSVLKAMLPQVPIVIYTAHDSSMIEPSAFCCWGPSCNTETRHGRACDTAASSSAVTSVTACLKLSGMVATILPEGVKNSRTRQKRIWLQSIDSMMFNEG